MTGFNFLDEDFQGIDFIGQRINKEQEPVITFEGSSKGLGFALKYLLSVSWSRSC